jgi:hypothetical protein
MRRYKIAPWKSAKMEPVIHSEKREPFKKCSNCGKSWLDRNQLLYDQELVVVGYQVHFKDLQIDL